MVPVFVMAVELVGVGREELEHFSLDPEWWRALVFSDGTVTQGPETVERRVGRARLASRDNGLLTMRRPK